MSSAFFIFSMIDTSNGQFFSHLPQPMHSDA
jgi:hypothetical protein